MNKEMMSSTSGRIYDVNTRGRSRHTQPVVCCTTIFKAWGGLTKIPFTRGFQWNPTLKCLNKLQVEKHPYTLVFASAQNLFCWGGLFKFKVPSHSVKSFVWSGKQNVHEDVCVSGGRQIVQVQQERRNSTLADKRSTKRVKVLENREAREWQKKDERERADKGKTKW